VRLRRYPRRGRPAAPLLQIGARLGAGLDLVRVTGRDGNRSVVGAEDRRRECDVVPPFRPGPSVDAIANVESVPGLVRSRRPPDAERGSGPAEHSGPDIEGALHAARSVGLAVVVEASGGRGDRVAGWIVVRRRSRVEELVVLADIVGAGVRVSPPVPMDGGTDGLRHGVRRKSGSVPGRTNRHRRRRGASERKGRNC